MNLSGGFGFAFASACAVALGAGGCSDPAPRPSREPVAILRLDDAQLATFDPTVAAQLAAAQERADRATQGGPAAEGDRAEAVGRLGQLYQTYDLAAPAESCYRRARQLDPEDWRWVYLLAVVLQTEGRLEAALEAFAEALDLERGHLGSLVRSGDLELQLDRPEAARAHYESALAAEPTCVPALWGLARLALSGGKPAIARAHLERGLELQPRANRLEYGVAQAYRRLGDDRAARHHAERQGTVAPSMDDPLLQEVAALRIGASIHMARAFEAHSRGDLELAVAEYRRAVSADPMIPEAQRGLAGALVELGDRTAARVPFARALDLEPASAMAHYNLASVLPDGESVEALRLLARAVELAPEVVEFRLERARRWRLSGDLAAARRGYAALAERRAARLAAGLGLAEVELAAGDTVATAERYAALEALDLDRSERAALHFHRARWKSDLRLGDLGASDFALAAKLDPDHLAARFALANLSGMNGRYGEAVEGYRAILERQPEHVGARLGEATALLLSGRPEEARATLQRGLEISPDEPNLAAALQRLGAG